MARSQPEIVGGTLCIGTGQEHIAIDSAAWFAWLEEVHGFAYTAGGARFVARKQPRGQQAYWYAYARCAGTVRGVYLGRSADLTGARLQAALIQLHGPPAREAAHTIALYGAHSPPARAVQQALAELVEVAPTGNQTLNLERVRTHLAQHAAGLTPHQTIDPATLTHLLDLAALLVAHLAVERAARTHADATTPPPGIDHLAIGGVRHGRGEVW